MPFSPHRTITVVTNQVVFILGEVVHPGMVIWTKGLTLTNAIAEAGGFTDFADKRRLEIRRRTGSVEQYSYRQAVAAGKNTPTLEHGDVVEVRRVFLW